VHVRGTRGGGRVNVAGVVCYRPGTHPHLLYRLHVYHGRSGETKSFTWTEYRDLIEQTHQHLDAPLVWCWDNLATHRAAGLRAYAAAHDDWLHIVHLPPYAPELNPAEGVWSLLKRSMVNFAAPNLHGLTRMVKRRLKKIQYRPDVITGCLTETGLTLAPTIPTSST
jgi:transposase